MTFDCLSDLLSYKGDFEKDDVNIKFKFASGNHFTFTTQSCAYRLELIAQDSSSELGATEFFRELGIKKPCKWINEHAYEVEEEALSSEKTIGYDSDDFPEAAEAITDKTYRKLFHLLYNKLDEVNGNKKLSDTLMQACKESSLTTDSYKIEPFKSSESIDYCNSIPTIPNLNPLGFNLSISITA